MFVCRRVPKLVRPYPFMVEATLLSGNFPSKSSLNFELFAAGQIRWIAFLNILWGWCTSTDSHRNLRQDTATRFNRFLVLGVAQVVPQPGDAQLAILAEAFANSLEDGKLGCQACKGAK